MFANRRIFKDSLEKLDQWSRNNPIRLVHEMKSQNIPPVKLSVVKYIPYGNLNEVLPYLVRRAEENRGMLGGSILEREALFDEIKRRIRKRFGITSKLTGVQSERE